MPAATVTVRDRTDKLHTADIIPLPVARRDGLILASLLFLCLATRAYFFMRLPYCAEDAYITFRYALNWAHGLGPVYNVGEKSWGFTSALWTSYLAFTSLIGIPIEYAARWTLAICDLATIFLGWRILREHSRLAAIGFCAFFATWPWLAHLPASGLESSLVTCLLLAAASQARTRWSGLLNGLLALSRPEGAAMSVILAWRLRPRQRWVWLGVLALQGCFSLYFGQLLPSSVTSKSTVYGVQWFQGLYWLEWLIPGMPARTNEGMALAPVAILIVIGVVAAVARWRRTPDASALPMLLGCGLVTLGAYMAVGAPFYFWYAPPPTVAVLLSAFFGLAISGVLRWALGPLLVFLLVAGVQAAPKVEHMQTHDAAVFANVGLTLRADAAGQPATVMLEPIGIVGYTSGLRVLDEVGLVTPWIAREREHGDGWYARVIRRERPEYVVIRRDWLEGGVAWAGLGRPFASRAQADSVLVGYAPLRVRHGEGPPPPGAGKLVVLRRK